VWNPLIFDVMLSLTRAKHDRSDWTLENDEMEIMMRESQNCRIFLTEDGTVGLAPTETYKGDMLCILRGSSSPSILRQQLENGWTLVSGDCYVPGEFFNYGDSISDYVDAHEDKEQEFLIW
jgi:hypothetical protein